MLKDIEREYFEWMYNLIIDNGYSKSLSYRELMWFLYNTKFTYSHERDSNRAADGIDFRYKFAYENGYLRDEIDRVFGKRPCNILEMMLALSCRLEDIMSDYDYGNRMGQWFWNMIVSLGLVHMSDKNFDLAYAKEVIFRFLNRQYKPNGEGGLFTLEHPKYDLRNEEIWYQAMWYLDENFDFSI